MDEPKKSTPRAADIGSEAHTGIPKAGNVTLGTTPNAADLTENELEDVVGGVSGTGCETGTGAATLVGGGSGDQKTARIGGGRPANFGRGGM